MALIRATCRECGDVELRVCDVHVRVCLDTQSATYYFRCPICRMTEVREAGDDVVSQLTLAGCAVASWRLPKELDEHPKDDQSPINHDDLLKFHELIVDGTDWFDQLEALVRFDTN